MITYFKNKTNKSKKKYENCITITTVLKSFDTFVPITTASSSIGMSLTAMGLRAIPISTATACGLSIGNSVLYEIIINKHKKYKKQYEKDQQAFKLFEKLFGKSLQDNMIDENEYESLCNFLLDMLTKESFLKN